MKPDYLWDKTGEPDADIVRLEQVLGTLRYKPRPLQIPDEAPRVKRGSYVPLLAIAATISILVIAAGLWLRLNRPLSGEISAVQLPSDPPITITRLDQDSAPPLTSTSILVRHPRALRRNRELTEATVAERKEAEAVKEQLMVALRLASAKLNLAQKKAQGTPTIIRNQHKVG